MQSTPQWLQNITYTLLYNITEYPKYLSAFLSLNNSGKYKCYKLTKKIHFKVYLYFFYMYLIL